MWICLGMGSIGLLVGSLVGMSSDHLSRVLLGLLFGLIGGSIAASLRKIPVSDRRLAGAALFALSLGCLIGVYSGILVSQYQLLTPVSERPWIKAAESPTSCNNESDTAVNLSYLRGRVEQAVPAILDAYKDKHYTRDRAVQEIMENFKLGGPKGSN